MAKNRSTSVTGKRNKGKGAMSGAKRASSGRGKTPMRQVKRSGRAKPLSKTSAKTKKASTASVKNRGIGKIKRTDVALKNMRKITVRPKRNEKLKGSGAHSGAPLSARKKRTKLSINIPSIEESKRVLNIISSNPDAVNYITKNISKRVLDVLNLLEEPMSDEEIAQTLDMKINAVRRILNIAQEYGITNYYVTKNTNGWLSFAWYINANKLPYFLDYISSNNKVKSVINDDCNDYFICKSCYGKDNVVFTFDAAFENSFKCNVCGTDFMRMDREEARKLIYPETGGEKTNEAVLTAP